MTGHVEASRRGSLGQLHLRRPEAINALTLTMIRELRAGLDTFEKDPRVLSVALTGEGDRGFCAGGDIRFVWEMAERHPERILQLWREEYELDFAIATYPKPVVSVADGITMGGGIGLASHAAHRVVTPRSRLAMPEVRIGLAPDVGGLWLLSRAPGEWGVHLALTADSADAPTSVKLGWADVVLPVGDVADLLDGLRSGGDPDQLLAEHSVPGHALPEVPEWVSRCYRFDDVGDIVDALRREEEPAADDAADKILAASPLAVAVTLAGIRAARDLELEECLVQDYRVSSRFLRWPDLVEGIRAQIVDKDRAPRWRPASLELVDKAVVAEFFAPVDDEDLLQTALTNVWTGHKVRT